MSHYRGEPDLFSFPEAAIPPEDIPVGFGRISEVDVDFESDESEEDDDDGVIKEAEDGIEYHVERILEKQGIHRKDWWKPENASAVQATFQMVTNLRGNQSEDVARDPRYWDDYNTLQDMLQQEADSDDEDEEDEYDTDDVDSVDEMEEWVKKKHRPSDAVEERKNQTHANTQSTTRGNVNDKETADTAIAPDGRDQSGKWKYALYDKKKKKKKRKRKRQQAQQLPIPEFHPPPINEDGGPEKKKQKYFVPDDFNEQRIQQELQPLGLQLFEQIDDKHPIGVQWDRIVEAYHDKLGIFMFVGEQESGKTFACKQFIAEKLQRNPMAQVIILCPGGSDKKKWGDNLHNTFNRVPIRSKIYDEKIVRAPAENEDDDDNNTMFNPTTGGQNKKQQQRNIRLPSRYIEVQRVRLYEDEIQTRLLTIIELQKKLYEAYREGRLDYPPVRLSIVLDDCLGLINMDRKGVKDAFDTVAGAARHVNCNVDLFILAQEINFFKKSIRGNCGCLFMFKCSDNQVPMLTECQSIHTEKELKFWKDRCCQQNQFLFYPRKYQPFVYLSKAAEFQKNKKKIKK